MTEGYFVFGIFFCGVLIFSFRIFSLFLVFWAPRGLRPLGFNKCLRRTYSDHGRPSRSGVLDVAVYYAPIGGGAESTSPALAASVGAILFSSFPPTPGTAVPASIRGHRSGRRRSGQGRI